MKLEYRVMDPHLTANSDLEPIIFLHGLAENRKSWKHIAPAIALRTLRKAYVLDARNHGESPRSSKMDYEVMAEDLLEFIDSHGIEKVIIVGHSMGGRTAITFTLKHPQRVECLIIEDMTPKNIHPNKTSIVHRFMVNMDELMKNLPSDMDLDEFKRIVMDFTFVDLPEGYREKYQKMYDFDTLPFKKVGGRIEFDCDFKTICSLVTSNSLVQNLPETYQPFNGDALFIYGSRPYFQLDKDPSLTKMFPRATLKKIVSSYTHYVHYDSPDEFIDIVSNYILHRNLNQSKY